MIDKHGTYIRCPHCGARIALRVAAPMKKGRDWAAIDWTRPTGRIAREMGVSRGVVSGMRRKHAPDTVGKIAPQAKYDWSAVNWALSNDDIARRLGTHPSYVSSQRSRFDK